MTEQIKDVATKQIHVKPSFYAYNFEPLKQIALKYGYNLVMHGSLNRDFDLVAIPWAEELIGSVPEMIKEMCEYIGGWIIEEGEESFEAFRKRKHGRVVYLININRSCEKIGGDWVDPQYYLDISVTPIV